MGEIAVYLSDDHRTKGPLVKRGLSEISDF